MRRSGILLPVFSLPGKYGIGDLSEEAYKFIDKLKDAGQHYWQILPLEPTTEENCPYQALSCFGGEPLYISPERLLEKGLISEDDLKNLADAVSIDEHTSAPAGNIDYRTVKPARYSVLRAAYQRFTPDPDYERFCEENSDWLDSYAEYLSKGSSQEGSDQDAAGFYKWTQYEFFDEWGRLKKYANDNGVEIIGDMPYFVSHKSVDVEAHRELFQLTEEGKMEFVSGAPPDGFTPDGQCWGDPLYDWDEHRATGFDWWIKRFRQKASMYDAIRIDHMRGFESYFAIPEASRDPSEGHWEKGPGIELFDAIKEAVGSVRIIAEDLGFLTDEVRQLIAGTGYPGMKVLQFAFDSDESNVYLPFNYDTDNIVVYTGTHDNDTTLGWYSKAEDWKKGFLTWYVREKSGFGGNYPAPEDEAQNAGAPEDEAQNADTPGDMAQGRYYEPYDGSEAPIFLGEIAVGAMIELAMSTRANTCIIPMQDYLGLDSSARINTPGTATGNWNWRMPERAFTKELCARIRSMTQKYSRGD